MNSTAACVIASAIVLLAAPLALGCSKSESSSSSGAAPGGSAFPTDPGVLRADEATARYQADKAGTMGKHLKVRGYYLGSTAEGGKLNAGLSPTADIMSKGPLCVFPLSAKTALDKLKSKTLFTASGTVTGDFFERPLLSDCTLE